MGFVFFFLLHFMVRENKTNNIKKLKKKISWAKLWYPSHTPCSIFVMLNIGNKLESLLLLHNFIYTYNESIIEIVLEALIWPKIYFCTYSEKQVQKFKWMEPPNFYLQIEKQSTIRTYCIFFFNMTVLQNGYWNPEITKF